MTTMADYDLSYDNDDDSVKHLILTGMKLSDRLLGKRSFAAVLAAEYNEIPCATKMLTNWTIIALANHIF